MKSNTYSKIKVLIVQHNFPHYHVPLCKTMASHPNIDLTFVHGTNRFNFYGAGPQENVTSQMPFRVIKGKIPSFHIFRKSILWHKPAVDLLKSESFDVVIHKFEVKFLSLGKIHKIQKTRGNKLILWGIGATAKKTPVIDCIRRNQVRKTDATIFYAESNRRRFISMGIDPEKLFVARNSIDLSPITSAVNEWPEAKVEKFRIDRQIGNGPVLLSVGRLIKRKRLDILLESAAVLRNDYPTLKVVIIGDGPESHCLKSLACKLNMEKNVIFTGEIIGDTRIAPWFLLSDIVIAPAQVGHLATHAHAYGCPLITCDKREIQGPEVEILVPNQTGLLYPYGCNGKLTETISSLLEDNEKRKQMGTNARRRALEYCGIPKMLEGFLQAISYVTNISLSL